MYKIGIVVVAMILLTYAEDNLLNLLNTNSSQRLAKTKKSELALTSYSSANFNITYTCPTGWTISQIDTVNSGGEVQLTIQSNNYLPQILVASSNFALNIYAQNYARAVGFATIGIAYNNSQGYMPGIYFYYDTSYSNGLSEHEVQVKENSSTGSYTEVITCFSEVMNYTCHTVLYFATLADFNTNSSVYLQHWKNTTFFNSALVKQTENGMLANKNEVFKKGNFDVLGRINPIDTRQIYIANGIKYLNIK